MGNIGIIYATKTKHSQKIAEAMGKALHIKAENIANHPILNEIDLLFIVGGIYGGESMPELLEFVRKIDNSQVKRVALVTSCASKKQGQKSVRKLLLERNIDVVDEMICQGGFLFVGLGHPNRADIEEVIGYASRIIKGIDK